ncbi:hypothetical protein GCK72_001121 [Caenorhabditis remanei]|uniref:DUF38 domain-containing protein n=1 Tax=Caenorhabditis remanei TaxID=31234 RepID=A0A6A5HRQ0_CAERE|nr:hypothetical protein GCK72_001121 [Caenorhabditis remanei]KAF1769304.1 hypothetical protein GCK72_001121 [Caenorhabditis remanei]
MPCWINLTVRMKQDIIGLLDYESRCQLRSCSKDDRDTVDSTKFTASKLSLVETQSEMSDGKTIVRCDLDTFTIWFIGKENITRVDRGWNGEVNEGLSEIKQENRYDVFRRFLQKISINGMIHAHSISIENIEFRPPEEWKPKCVNLKVTNIQNNHIVEWLQNSFVFSRNFKKLEISCWGEDEGIGELIPALEITDTLKLNHETNLTDEEVERIKAIDLNVSSHRITVEAAKRIFERFLRLSKKSDSLELRINCPEGFDFKTDVLPGHLNVKRFKKDNEDRGEYYGKIFGGFENVHNVYDAREVECIIFQDSMRISCEVYERSTNPCTLWPF